MLVAANLRPTITSLGPVLEQVGVDRQLDTVSLGLLGAVPMLSFALISPIVQQLSRKFGAERAVWYALIVLTLGTIIRSLPGANTFVWIGTILLAASIAVGNVLLPAIVKREFPKHVSIMTSTYAVVMSGFAALGSAVAFPISQHWGWEFSLGVWAATSLIAAAVWTGNLKKSPKPEPVKQKNTQGVWTSTTAWQIAVFMGLQSLPYFLLVTWLPTYEASIGIDEVTAGIHLFLYQVVGIFGGLIAGPFLNMGKDQRPAAAVLSSLMILAGLGIVFVPYLLILWLILGGVSSGACMAASLAMIALRARTPGEAAALSGMVQGCGYVIAAAGPWGAAWLYDTTKNWDTVFIGIAILSAIQLTVGLFAGRDVPIRFRGEEGSNSG